MGKKEIKKRGMKEKEIEKVVELIKRGIKI
jgi:glycine/serine hydroxymethyltransferase